MKLKHKNALINRIRRTLTILFLRPKCLLGPAVWLSNSESARIHRRVCLSCQPSLGRTSTWLLFVSKVLLWYTFLVWVSLFKTILISQKSPFRALDERKSKRHFSIWKKLGSWVYLGLWLGAKPQSYFSLKLYANKRESWLDYAFPQEQSNWHASLGFDDESMVRATLADKLATEQRLRKANIPCVITTNTLISGSLINENVVFVELDLFIKPNSYQGMRGCARLTFSDKSTDYHLSGYDLEMNRISIYGKENIASHLQILASSTDLLVQVMLFDHDQLTRYSDPRDISTLRIITCNNSGSIRVAHAMLEVAKKHDFYWDSYRVDVGTGALVITPDLDNKAQFRKGFCIPHWDQVCQNVRAGHQVLGRITTISWDVCVSPNGPVIIEGNSGWGLAAPQAASQSPLLRGELLSVYAQNL